MDTCQVAMAEYCDTTIIPACYKPPLKRV